MARPAADSGEPGIDAGKLLTAGFSLLQQNGGLAGLVDNLNRSGLADQASSTMSQLLPELIHQLTPKGNVPDDHADLVSQGLSMRLGKRRARAYAMLNDGMNGVHHVVWCVRPESFPDLRAIWEGSVGLTLEELDLPELGVKILISWNGGVEIMAPFYDKGAFADVARRFLAERGEGVYTIVVNVRRIDELVASLVARGASLSFRETIPPDAVLERKLSDGERFSILQAGFDQVCGMPICLQEIVPE